MKITFLVLWLVYFTVLLAPKEESKGGVECYDGKCHVVKYE